MKDIEEKLRTSTRAFVVGCTKIYRRYSQHSLVKRNFNHDLGSYFY